MRLPGAIGNDMSDYDMDFYAWSRRQGALLRRLSAGERVNDTDMDWSNIAEEIETLGRSERGAVAGQIANILEHLMTLQASPAAEPHAGWQTTIDRARADIERLWRTAPVCGARSQRSFTARCLVQDAPRWARCCGTAKRDGYL
jgi:hypothetical protein